MIKVCWVILVSQRIGALEDFRGRILFLKELGFHFCKNENNSPHASYSD